MALLNKWLDNAVSNKGSARALLYRDSYLSWRGLRLRVDKRARELRQLGVGPGDWIGLMLGNVPETVILGLAAEKIGALVAPLDPATSARDLDMILGDAPFRAIVTRPLAEAPLGPRSERPRHTPLTLRVTEPGKSFQPRCVPENKRRISGTLLTCNIYARNSSQDADKRGGVPADGTVVHYSCDAGGDPAGVIRGPQHLQAVADTLGKTLNLQAGQSVLLPTALHYAYAFDLGLVAALSHQLTLILEDELSPRSVAAILREETISYVVGTAALYGSLARDFVSLPLKAQPQGKARLLCAHGAGSARVAEAFHKTCSHRLLTVLHQSECGPISFDEKGRAPQTTGVPMAEVSLRIVGPGGKRLPHGVLGQLWIKSPACSTHTHPPLPASIRAAGHLGIPIGGTDDDGWMRTGDVAMVDGDGRLRLSGREDDLATIDGKRVALGEVAGCIESFDGVREADAEVVYDDVAGPIVIARVVTAGTCRQQDIIDHCARNLAPFKVPREIRFCSNLD